MQGCWRKLSRNLPSTTSRQQGALVFAIGLSLLEVKKVKVANLLPAVCDPSHGWVVSLF